MTKLQVKRNCDPGVSTAVSSIIQHQNFKKMLMFGLRSLSDYCNPSSKLYKENAYDALNRGATTSIKNAVMNYKDDDDILFCSSKILWAMSDYCYKEKDQEALQKLISDGGVDAVIEIIKGNPKDTDTVKNCMVFIENLNNSAVQIEGTELGTSLLNNFTSNSYDAKLEKEIVGALAVAAKSSSGSKALNDAGAQLKLLEHSMGYQTLNDDVACVVERVFDTIKNMASNGYIDPSLIEKCVVILDKFSSYPKVVTKGSEAMKYAVGPEQLQNCLKVLKTTTQGSKEQDAALELLSSLSYISSITDEVVKSGGIPVLIELINSGLQQYESNPEKISRLIAGASRMLGRISSTPANAAIVDEYGGIASLCTALSYCPDNVDCACSICRALIPFVSRTNYVSEIINYSLFASLFPILYGALESVELAKASMECIAAATMLNEFHEQMVNNQAIEILSTCIQYHTTETDYQMNCLKSYFRLSDHITSIESIQQYGGVSGIAEVLTMRYDNSQIAECGLKLINKMLAASDALKYLRNQQVVDAVLSVMLENETEEVIVQEGTKILEKLATEEDCQRHIGNLESVINSAHNNTEEAYKTLAAISGLSRIQSLRSILQAKKADHSIYNGIKVWIEAPRFNDQSKLIKAGLKTIKNLRLGSGSAAHEVIVSLVDVITVPQAKKVIEYDEPDDNILITTVTCIVELTKNEKIESASEIEITLDSIVKLMKKYSESRLTQIGCLEAINNIIVGSGVTAVDILISKGYMKHIVSYLQKVPMYADAQISGFTVLSSCVKVNPESIEAIRKVNTLVPLQTAIRTHAKNTKLKVTCAPLLALLMPLDSLIKEIEDLMKMCEKAMNEKNLPSLHESLCALNELLLTPEASKISVRCKLGECLVSIQEWLNKNPDAGDKVTPNEYEIQGRSLYDATISEVAHANINVAQTRVGLVHLTKCKTTVSMINAYEDLKFPGDEYTEEAVSNILEALSLLLKHDIVNSDVAFNQGLVKKLCLGINHFADSAVVIKGTCGCLAGMCTSDKRVQQLISHSEYEELVNLIVKLIGNTDKSQISRTNAIKALYELLRTNREEIVVNIASKTNVVDSLFKIMEEYETDLAVVQEGSKCLAIIADYVYLEQAMNIDKFSAIRILLEVLSKNKNDEETALEILRVLAKLCNANDKMQLKELGAIDVVSDVMMIHSENDEITRLGGLLFSYMGADEQVKTLMKLILNVKSDDPDAVRKIVNLTGKLELFLRAPLDDPADALQYTEATLQVLNTYLAANPNNMALQANIALVTKRLVDRVRDDPEDQLGSWAVASAGTLNQYMDMTVNEIGKNNPKFIAPMYNVLDGCVLNPYTKQLVMDQLPQLLAKTNLLLEQHKNKPEVVAAIFQFMAQVAADPEGAAMLKEHSSAQLGNLSNYSVQLMNLNRTHDGAVVSGMDMLGQISLSANETGFVNEMKPAELIKINEQLMLVNPTKDRVVAFIRLVDRMVLGNLLDEAVASDALKQINTLVSEENLAKYNEQDRNEIMLAYAALLKDCGDTGLYCHLRPVEKTNALNCLVKIEEISNNPEVTNATLDALSSISANDSVVASKIGITALNNIMESDEEAILTNDVVADKFLQLLENLVVHDGVGRQLANNEKLQKLLDELEESYEKRREELGDEAVDAMKLRINNIRNAMMDDRPKEKTCKDVYDKLVQYVEEKTPIGIVQDDSLDEDLTFVLDRLNVYAQDTLQPTSEAGTDYAYGYMACEIFCDDAGNVEELVKREFETMGFHCLINQPHEKVKHHACRALCAFTKNPKGLEAVTKKIKNFPQILSKSVGDLKDEKTLEHEVREEFIKSRVLLIDRTAFNRNVYDKTKAMHNLISIWDDFDKGYYSILLLRHVFRAMRKIVSDAHVQTLLDANVLYRLIEIVNSDKKDNIILPDVLFLLGSLAVVHEIKTMIGELKGIEACVNLLLRSMHVEKMEPTITNCCLALANMCIDYKPNSNIFFNLKGPDLNVRILREYRSHFDITNGASVLLCNVLFKNEAMKKYYGTNGAPLELVECLRNYDGCEDKNAFRCLESLFKAISNLSLYTSNVQYFLDAKIEVSYESWLNKLNESFPDEQLETGLRTLSNLVMENEERNMRNFGITLIPVLNVLKQNREDTKVLFLLMDILSSLCRLNDNAKTFADNNGIETIIDKIQKFDYDVNILTLAIHLLGIQSKIESSLPVLVNANVFGILISCTEVDLEEPEMIELVVSGLRCIRRLIQSEELAYEFCNCGGIASVANVICKSVNHSIVMLEVLRVLLCVLYHTQNVEGVTNEYPEEEEEMHNAVLGGWYNVSMDKEMIDAIIQAILTCANDEQHLKQLRLQKVVLGLLAYFAYHRIGIISMTASGFDALCRETLTSFAGDPVIMQLLALIIDNTAMYSGEIYETTITREIVKNFKNGLSKFPKGKEEKAIQAKLTLTLNAMNSPEDPMDSFKDTLLIFDFSLSEFDVDPYLNGVHDLPVNVKENLRKGGMFKIFVANGERKAFKWKSSQDLNALEWTVGDNVENVFKIPIVRIRNVSKGLVSPALQAANKKEPRKVNSKVTLCIFGPAMEDFPNGLELSIKTKTQKERDGFVDLIVLWRDASSYNY